LPDCNAPKKAVRVPTPFLDHGLQTFTADFLIKADDK
jgi:hypothetical protein